LSKDKTAVPSGSITPQTLKPYLKKCGYVEGFNLATNYKFNQASVPLAGFYSKPFDTRSACLAVLESPDDGRKAAASCAGLGAPTAIVCGKDALEWWSIAIDGPKDSRIFSIDEVDGFFRVHGKELSPESIYSAKMRRSPRGHPTQTQLWFVDIGLMPATERRIGETLHRLVVSLIQGLANSLGSKIRVKRDYEDLYKTVFWLLAAKILHEKGVDRFKRLTLTDIDEVFARVGKHYADVDGLPPGGAPWRQAIEGAASLVAQWGYLGNISTESLAYLYETALIEKNPAGRSAVHQSSQTDIRKELGIHSTPSILIDHMLSSLWPLIEEHTPEERHVFEPACGPASFLVASMRWMRDFSDISDSVARHKYLRDHIRGIEVDPFASQVAKLSLTLADVPNGNSWVIQNEDMFSRGVLEDAASKCTLLLANPPFEAFSKEQRLSYQNAGSAPSAVTKAMEMVNRTLPSLRPGSVFGLVLPQGALYDKESRKIREFIVRECELIEIDLFADKLFEQAEHEVTVLMGRRCRSTKKRVPILYRRVREKGISAFKDRLAFSSEQIVPQSRFADSRAFDLRVPELDEVWQTLRGNQTLATIAALGQGISYRSEASLSDQTWTVHDPACKGDILGYYNVPSDLVIYDSPIPVGMNLDDSAIARRRSGMPTGNPSVIYTYSRVSRGPWRIKAFVDEKGRPVGSSFVRVSPLTTAMSCTVLWSLLNSPIANAFAYCCTMSRAVSTRKMGEMPLPSNRDFSRVIAAANQYRDLARKARSFMDTPLVEKEVRDALVCLDAEILRLYKLPPRLERELLDLFLGWERKGVGCDFGDYYPTDLTSFVPLHEFISEEYLKSTAGKLRRRHKPADSAELVEALRGAAKAFSEE
jgi:hypothetical protein